MAKYVMSDVHGDYDRFIAMIKKIGLKEEDELYIIGDVIDRGDNPYKVIDYIVCNKNIHLLKGNHEKLFEDYYETGDASLWYYNGGRKTHDDFLKRGYYVYDSLYKYIKKLPYIKVVDNFILTHGGLNFEKNYKDMDLDEFIKAQKEDYCIWDRKFIKSDYKFKDFIVVCGHTPVQNFQDKNNFSIVKKDNFILIDCGCGTSLDNRKLGCLRLDDFEEFYV